MGLILEIVTSQVSAQNFSLGRGGGADPYILYNLCDVKNSYKIKPYVQM
jgi:hypothetical protein